MAKAAAPVETGEQLLARGRIPEALRSFRAALAERPDDERLLHRLTDALAMAGHLEEAAALQNERFEACLRAAQAKQAIALFARLNWLQPQPAARWLIYAQALESCAQPAEAVKAYRQTAAAFRREGDPKQEAAAWRAVFRLNPSDYSTCLEIATRAEAAVDFTLAGEACGKAAALLHEDAPLLARACRFLPADGALRRRYVHALLAAGQHTDALESIRPLAPAAGWPASDDADLLALYVDVLIANRLSETAAELIVPFLERADWFERGLRCLHALARDGRPQAALFAAELEDKSGLEKRHLQWVRELHALRAEVHERGLLDFLAAAFNRAGEEPAMLWILHQSLGLAVEAGDMDRAADMLERIVATDPNDPEPAERLRALHGLIPPVRWERLRAAVERAHPAAAPLPTAPPAPSPPVPAALAPATLSEFGDAPSISQITPVIRALARETTPRRVFFSAVNHLGRVWKVDRCLAANFHSGQPPVNVVEYCAPGVASSFAAEAQRLLTAVEKQFRPPHAKAVLLPRESEDPQMAALLAELGIRSLLAQPLSEAGSVVGAVLLQFCSSGRTWTQYDLHLLEALAEQLVLVLGHARLRALLQQFTAVDERTGLLKISSMLEVLVAECARAQQQSSTVSVMALETVQPDRDFIRSPQAQDWMLTVTERMGAYLRPYDVLTRLSPTQFVLVLPDTVVANCRAVFRKLRGVLSDRSWPNGSPLALAAGAAEIAADYGLQAEDIATDVLDRAMRALEERLLHPEEELIVIPPRPLAAAPDPERQQVTQ